ncbi:hypothetical protein BO70DRAFT_361197 [Aspergillus heteromorphus CBS 117.55]|uniref:O-methyltransferase dimerisation domain-containing protein n=1 Tax=Aspergillus heteromorphus CBS 117.55 TaxID=1448321 RepID=A0A317WIB3_9EURO|nr:uncharacterized protein BO70DRAFT_361197 [Aspergillus heteromorphus CBS 117.55]PWY84798.1 hypothetical protein BO70DRAFT_361197 [Aspergillus heteromorphus CBS 117.55]
MESPTEMLALAQQLETAAMAPSQLPPASDELHARLLAAARNLITVLETPETELMHLAKAPVAHGVLRAALRIRLFERFDEGAPTATDLAQRCGTDVALLTRIMRTLASIGIFTEPTPGIYAHTPRSTTLRHAQHRAVIQGMAETATLMTALPDFLDTHHWQNPVDSGPTLFGFAHHTDQTMFEWLEGQPEQRAIFAAFQSGTTALAICQLQPFLRDLLLTSPPPAPAVSVSGSSVSPLVPDQDQDRVTLVDVGGGRGAVLREVSRELLPTRPPGRIVLQDLPNVVEGLGVSDGVEAMPYNFLDPQPVKGNNPPVSRLNPP